MSKGRKKKKGASGTVKSWVGYLRGEGVAPGPVTPEVDAAVELLAGTTDRLPDVGGDVAEALCSALSAEDKLELVARCTAEGGRDLAKAARRALHGQRRRGTAVPKVKSARPQKTTKDDLHADARAHISAPFGGGNRILLCRFRGNTDRVLHAAMADLSDTQGLQNLQLYRGGAKVYRTMVAESRDKLPGTEIGFGYALYTVQQAMALSRQTERILPDHVSTLRTLLGSSWPVSEVHPAEGLEPGEVGTDEALFALWELAELRSWTPADETLAELTAGVGEVLQSKLVVVELQRGQRLAEQVQKAVAREIDGDGRTRWAQRLRDAAWVMHENQHVEAAAQVLGVRKQLLESQDPAELVFFQQLVGRMMLGRLPPEQAMELIPGLGPAQPSTGATDPGGVIWTPGSSNEPDRGDQGGGGLIIPGR